MPKIYKRRSFKRRAFKRKAGASGGSAKRRRMSAPSRAAVIPRNRVTLGKGFPKMMTMTHKYVETITPSASSIGSFQSYLFSCNGMYDPNTSGTGHQPMYFDQMSALYDHYVVIGSKIVFTFCSETTAANTIRVVAFINDDVTVTPTSCDMVAEQTQGSRTVYIPAGGSTVKTISMKWSAKKMFGKSVLANVDLQGTSASNPAEASYYTLCYQADDGATLGINFTATITYIAVWKELKDLVSS